MNYTKEENKEYAIKLVAIKIQRLLNTLTAINRGDHTNEEIKKLIKRECTCKEASGDNPSCYRHL